MRSSACYRSSRVRQPRPYGRGFFISWLYASDDSKHATGVELNTLTVGLFGTCGGSRWREPFIARYEQLGIPYFNPQVDDWKPELAEIEAWHLVHDQFLLFPVTGETYGTGRLAETGFSILSALRGNSNRFVVIHIDPDLAPELKDKSPAAAKKSLRARKLVLEHLAQTKHPNVFIVDSL